MNLHDAEYFVAIVEERSFSRAAAKLFVAQPSLSTFLSRLEKSMGVTLILRTNNNFMLTRSGEIYYKAAKEILEINRKMLEEIDHVKKLRRDTINVGVSGERTIRLISSILPEFYKKYPNVHVVLCENNTQNLITMLEADELDFSIHPVHVANPNFEQVKISCEEVLVALPRSHRLAHLGNGIKEKHNSISINELKNDRFVLLSNWASFRKMVDAYFERMGFIPESFTEVQSNHSNMLVLSGGINAVGFCPCKCDYGLDNLVYVALQQPFYYQMDLCYRKGNVLSPTRKYFSELIQKYGDNF